MLELSSSPVTVVDKVARARVSLRALLSLACLLPGCAELLDLPDNPHLAPAAEMSPSDAGVRSPERVEAGSGVSREPVPPGDESAEAADLPLLGSDVGDASAAVGGRSPPEPTPSTQPADAGAPPPETPLDTPSAVSCALDERAGPDGHCYFLLTELLSWDDARQRCNSRAGGWDLTSVRSEPENRFVAQLVGGEAWIGASDVDVEGTWRWVDDGTASWLGVGAEAAPVAGAYSPWFQDEPNGEDSSNCARLLRLELVTETGAPTWGDQECEELLVAVCEGPPQ